MVKRRGSVSHRPYPFQEVEPGEKRHCAFCRREIREVPGHQYQASHWRHVPRPRSLSTSGY